MQKKLTNKNKESFIKEWLGDEKGREDEYYFIASEINIIEIQSLAFENNVLIKIEQVDSLISKITFVGLLN